MIQNSLKSKLKTSAAVVAAAFALHAETVKKNWTVTSDERLTDNVTVNGTLALDGATIELNGHTLTVKGITGDGIVTDGYVIFRDAVGNFYLQLEYLEGTGTQYIKTGYTMNAKSTADFRACFTGLPDTTNKDPYHAVFGCRGYTGQGNVNAALHLFSTTSKTSVWQTLNEEGDTGLAVVQNTDYAFHIDMSGAAPSTVTGGEHVNAALGTANAGTCGGDVYLFNVKQGPAGFAWNANLGAHMRLYSLTFSEDGTPVHDFVPARRFPDGALGLYDKNNGQFLVNSGSGAFIGGPYVTTGAATGAGELHVAVDEGQAHSLAAPVKIVGNVRVMKEGAGTLSLPTAGLYFTGGVDVRAGTLSLAGPATSLTGANLGGVTVASGAKASIPATDGLVYGEAFTLDGGTLELVCSGTAEPVTTYITNALALNGGAKIRFDTSSFDGTQFLLSTDGFMLGAGVESAVSCVDLSTPTEAVAEASGANGILVTVTPLVMAVWTGAASNNDFSDPANWSCTNAVGEGAAGAVPTSHTMNYALAADADWRAATVTIPEGATLNMNGRRLTVSGLVGTGTITDSATGYAALAYLEGTGTQYIKTGYTMNAKSTADFRACFTGLPDTTNKDPYHAVFGCRGYTGQGNVNAALHLFSTTSKTSVWQTLNEEGDTGLAVVQNTDYAFHIDMSGAAPSTVTGGEHVNAALGTANAGTCGGDVYLFNVKQGPAGFAWNANLGAHMRLYSLTFSEDGTPVHDFVPARRFPDGALGLYDTNNGQFLVNSGSGAFIGGTVTSNSAFSPVAGGELEVDVPEGQTATIDTVNIAGSVKLVKTGLGTLVMAKAQTYLNGTDVSAGVLRPGTADLATPCGAVGSKISASADGTVDFNGNANMSQYVYDFADGAKALNGGASISSGVFAFTSFYTPVSTGAFTASLFDGATLDLTEWNGSWPLSGVAATVGATVTVVVDMDAETFRNLAKSKDAETGKRNGKLLTFGGARPADTTFVPASASADRCRFIEDENGDIILAFKPGVTVLIR